MLEERLHDLVADMEKMNFKVSNLKGAKEGSDRGGNEEYLLNKVIHLKEENATLRNNLTNEKMRRTKVERES